MPVIHHPELQREQEVSHQQAEILTTVPRLPWKLGPLPKPTAITKSPVGDIPDPPQEED